METNTTKAYRKCANYSIISAIVINTINAMGRFNQIPRDKISASVYDKIKKRAAVKS